MKRVDLGLKLAAFGVAVIVSLGADGGCQSDTMVATGRPDCVDLKGTGGSVASLQLNLDDADRALADGEYGRAIARYAAAAEAPGLRTQAYKGLGDTYFAQRSFERAQECYAEAVAAAPQGASSMLLTQAHDGNGKSLLALRRSGGLAEPQSGPSLVDQAIAEFQSALAAEPTRERHINLADAFLEKGQTAQALSEFNLGASNAAPATPGQADVGLALSRALTSPSDKLQVLSAVLSADSGSLEANTEAGKIYFNQGQYGPARDRFDTAIRLADTGTASPSSGSAGTLAVAEAHYYRSVILTSNGRPSRDSEVQMAISDADAAGASAPARRQACLARILVGGDYLNGAGSNACENSTTAEGQLVRGMLLVRRAQQIQSIGVNERMARQFRQSASAAQTAFDSGLDALTDDEKTQVLDWPGAPTNGVTLEDLLSYGSAVIVRGSSCLDLDVRSAANADASRAFFSYYHANGCRPPGA